MDIFLDEKFHKKRSEMIHKHYFQTVSVQGIISLQMRLSLKLCHLQNPPIVYIFVDHHKKEQQLKMCNSLLFDKK